MLPYRHPDVSLVWEHTSISKSFLKNVLKQSRSWCPSNWSEDYLISLQSKWLCTAVLQVFYGSSLHLSTQCSTASEFLESLNLIKSCLSWFCFWNRETSDLLTCVADLQYKNQKLQEENNKLKLTLEAADETNNKLVADNENLHQQVKR